MVIQMVSSTPMQVPVRLWQVVSIDFVTGLPRTERGYDASATFTDKLSKMVHVVPMLYAVSSAAQVARMYFDQVWRLHGAPMKIVCDRDSRFRDEMHLELHRLMGVQICVSWGRVYISYSSNLVVLNIHFNLVAIYMEIQTFTTYIMQEYIQIYAGDTVYNIISEERSRSQLAEIRPSSGQASLLGACWLSHVSLVADYYYY